MKTLRHVLLLLWCLIYMAFAREVKIQWDAAPPVENVVGWRIYKSGTLIASSNVPSATLTLTNEESVITVTAVNAVGESPPSEPLTIPVPLIWIQKSTDLKTWENVVQIPYVQPSQFIRLQLPP